MANRIELLSRRAQAWNRLSPERAREDSMVRLRDLIRWHTHDSRNSAYRDLLGAKSSEDLKPDANLEQMTHYMAALPVVDKAFLAKSDYIGSPATLGRRLVVVETSGTTSTVVRIPHTIASVETGLGDSALRCLADVGLTSADRFWSIGHRIYPGQNTGSFLSFEWQARVTPEILISKTTEDLDTSLAAALDHQPTCMASAPGFLARLARHALDKGGRQLRPRVVKYGGAALSEDARALVQEAFRPERILAFYPTTDAGPIGWSRNDDGRYATFAETHFVEILDAEGVHVEPGQRGQLVVSVLNNKACPQIRYRVGDDVTYEGVVGNRKVVSSIKRSAEIPFGDGLLALSEVQDWRAALVARGFPIAAMQLVLRRADRGRDQPIIRAYGRGLEHDALLAAVHDVMLGNWQVASEFASGTIVPLQLEILQGDDESPWKVKPVLDERLTP